MNSPTNGRSIVLCKWQPQLAKDLIDRVRVHVVLDDFDVAHAGIDQEVLSRAASVHVVSSFNALEELGTAAVAIRLQDQGVDKVVSFTEFSQLGAGYLSEVLGLGVCVPGSVAGRDKRWMKHLLAVKGLAVPPFHSLPDRSDEAAVAALADQIDYPVVVKPAAGFGTMSTYLARGAAEFTAICESFAYEPQLASRQLTVETYIDGEELHVDSYWGADGPHFLFVSRYFAPRLTVQYGQLNTDGSELLCREDHPELYAELEALTKQVMDGLDLTETMIHLEVFRQPDGRLVFSEIASRVGGGWVSGLISHAMGRPIWSAMADIAIDGRTEPPRPDAPYLGVLHLRPDGPGRIVEVPTVAEIEATPGVIQAQVWRGEGDVLQMRHPSEWVAFAFVGADTADELHQLFKTIPQALPVRTVPVEHDDISPSG
ncbi:ATP-grasp domain-containing protein [Kutzneria chonburiensis]|uniref:ATP-grasp domain-containing protein n=1 Tax=Kutzneria chonburiensis TaxID=1483604 RepID=A0ABV6MQJ3_9PSEU|nr:ATP-grasp domain-containing protein [Kutzneria chonburiensis]